MTFGEDFGWGSSIDESRQVFNTFLDKGGNFIDTADFYTNGSSEKLIGEFSQGIRDRLVITSKYTFSTDPQHNSNAGGNQRKHMIQAVEQSLRRLKTDYIDLYMVHIWDSLTPYEIMRGLDGLRKHRKNLIYWYVGCACLVDSKSQSVRRMAWPHEIFHAANGV